MVGFSTQTERWRPAHAIRRFADDISHATGNDEAADEIDPFLCPFSALLSFSRWAKIIVVSVRNNLAVLCRRCAARAEFIEE
jgi:hypothetical protein